MKLYQKTCPQCLETVACTQSAAHKAKTRKSVCFLCRNKNFAGAGNPFYGKKHTVKTKRRLSLVSKTYTKTKEFSAAVKKGTGGKTNKKPLYQCWLESGGKEFADKRFALWRLLQSKNSAKKNNPMWSRPSPQGSGNGWKGHYLGVYFRSLRELRWLMTAKEQGTIWRSAETNEFKIPYKDYAGQLRNYFPDFFIEPNTIVECKPKRLWTSPLVSAKTKAALKFCKKKGYIYDLVDPGIVEKVDILREIAAGAVTMDARYIERLDKF